MTLGQNIARLRTQKNLSQGDLADALEVSRQSVSKWETGKSVPDTENIRLEPSALAGVLNQLKADGDTFLAVRETKY